MTSNTTTSQNELPKILFVCGSLGLGGAEKQLYYLCKLLTSKNITIEVVCFTMGEHYEKLLQGLNVTIHNISGKKSPITRLFKIVSISKKLKPDIIQSAHAYTNLYAKIATMFTKSISIGAMRTSTDRMLNEGSKTIRYQLSMPDFTIYNSQTAIEETVNHKIASKKTCLLLENVIEEIPSPIKVDKTKTNFKIKLVYVGRLVDVKQPWLLLDIASKLKEKKVDFGLTIIGYGKLQNDIAAGIENKKLPDNVSLYTNITNVNTILGEYDVLLLTSKYEGFPNVILEAFANGLPVITNPAGDAKYLVENGVNGYVVSKNDIDEFCDYISLLQKNPDLLDNLGNNAYQTVQENYFVDSLSAKVANVYAKIAESTGNKRIDNLANVLK